MSLKNRKNAIRKAITEDNEAKEQPIDANAVILARFLEGCYPVESFGPGVTVMTTDDIISSLSDMADIGQDDVNRVLAKLGYKPGRNSVGSFGWMIKRIDL